MKYARSYETEDESVAALKAFDPTVIALFGLREPMMRKQIFGIAEAILESLESLIPPGESMDGFLMTHENESDEPDDLWGTHFALALREVHEPSYFNLDAVDTFRWAVAKAKKHPVYGKQVAEAAWVVAPGQSAISEIGAVLMGREDDQTYRCMSDNHDPVTNFFPITGTSIEDGAIGHIAEFIGVFPGKMHTGRREGPIAELQQHKEVWAAAGIT